MTDVTQILGAIQAGNPTAAAELLPLVYEELRLLAAAQIAHEKPGQTLQATALVHEAYLRLVGSGNGTSWHHRGHFYAAASEAMRRILVEAARRKHSLKRGGGRQRQPLAEGTVATPEADENLLALDDALNRLETVDPLAVQLVHLRYFSGLTAAQSAEALGLAPRTADRLWAFARAWLFRELSPS